MLLLPGEGPRVNNVKVALAANWLYFSLWLTTKWNETRNCSAAAGGGNNAVVVDGCYFCTSILYGANIARSLGGSVRLLAKRVEWEERFVLCYVALGTTNVLRYTTRHARESTTESVFHRWLLRNYFHYAPRVERGPIRIMQQDYYTFLTTSVKNNRSWCTFAINIV